MVDGNLALKIPTESVVNPLTPDPLKYTSVSLVNVLHNNTRLDASAFNLDAKAAKHKITNSPYGFTHLIGDNSVVKEAYNAGRFRRNYVSKKTENAVGFIGSAEMLDVNPKALKYITDDLAQEKNLYVKKGTVLLSCSGTIGNSTYVNTTLEKYAFSQHIIRLVCNNYSGYIYACLNLPEIRCQILSNVYGGVILEIEPEHLKNVIIPNAPEQQKRQIHELIIESFELRDQSNELIDEAERILYEELKLPPIEQLEPVYYNKSVSLRNFTTKLSNLNLRADCSYHIPIVSEIIHTIAKNAKCICHLGDNDISRRIILPGRFKRTYVDDQNGIPFFGGKQLLELNPSNIKYLSIDQHSKRINKELFLKENMIAVTCSGTIGKVNIVPKHWEGWALNQHVMRIVPANNDIAGYIYCWLNTDYAYQLIVRNTYGSVVDEINEEQLASVAIPILKDSSKQKEINDKILQANSLRYQAYQKEQEAINTIIKII